MERKIIGMYQNEKQKEVDSYKSSQAKVEEWNEVVNRYSNNDTNEDYPTDPEFDMTNQKGKLFTLAKEMYDEEDSIYRERKNGMLLASADAFRKLTLKTTKKTSKESKDKKVIERELANEKAKSELNSGGSDKPDTDSSDSEDTVSDYIKERRAQSHMMTYGE